MSKQIGINGVKPDLVTPNENVIYVPLASYNNFGVVKIDGSTGLKVIDGVLKVDQNDLEAVGLKEWNSGHKYSVGTIVWYDARLIGAVEHRYKLYKCIAEVGAIIAPPDYADEWVEVCDLSAIAEKQDANDNNLNTLAKNIVEAINEIKVTADSADTLSKQNEANKQDKTDDALNTVDKTVVGAINEVRESSIETSTNLAILESNVSDNTRKLDKIYNEDTDTLDAPNVNKGTLPVATERYVDTTNRELEARVDEKIAGITRTPAIVFDTLDDFKNWVLGTYTRPDGLVVDDLVLGDQIMIKAKGVPDYWYSSDTKPVTYEDNFTIIETQVDLSGYLQKATERDIVYATDKFANQIKKEYNVEPYGGGLAERTQDGRLKGADALEDNDLTTKKQLDNAVPEMKEYLISGDAWQDIGIDIIDAFKPYKYITTLQLWRPLQPDEDVYVECSDNAILEFTRYGIAGYRAYDDKVMLLAQKNYKPGVSASVVLSIRKSKVVQ